MSEQNDLENLELRLSNYHAELEASLQETRTQARRGQWTLLAVMFGSYAMAALLWLFSDLSVLRSLPQAVPMVVDPILVFLVFLYIRKRGERDVAEMPPLPRWTDRAGGMPTDE